MGTWSVSLVALAATAHAAAGVTGTIAFTDFATWSIDGPVLADFPAGWVTMVETQSFDLVPDGSVASLFGGGGWNAWNLSASSGSMDVHGGIVSASEAGGGLTFYFGAPLDARGSGLHGVGGDFGLRGPTGGWMPGRIILNLSTGVSLVQDVTTANPFAGFWITTPEVTITSLTVMPYGEQAGSTAVSIDNLYLGYAGVVPGPGSMALLAVGGMLTRFGRVRRANA